MSEPAPETDYLEMDRTASEVHVDEVFDTAGVTIYEKQRRIDHYLSQETRHQIVQALLGHPKHLASLTELDYYIPKSRSAIRDQLYDLKEHAVLTLYPNEDTTDRDLPKEFWGFTSFGVSLLDEYNYLEGLPVMRVAHDHTHRPAQITRHQNAPRPTLPVEVKQTLTYDEPEEDLTSGHTNQETTANISELRNATLYADAAPEITQLDADNGSTDDEERRLEELL
ncbi:hypothetical protein HAPAU_37360 [Halalkalicoccus paucihalophilus]|uniref:Uncharacterized protein n=1 Tax=Halalkalicoccus paucihalophilus TaxID=1008153 RepID=A0A151A9F4_9EURY|nr:hypothetical protein [Halalkalicoccus paucihalophilus]KYH24265.1 hypothetical protein HAPAU_37360 [Halalkalicoccus paucihalophilus]